MASEKLYDPDCEELARKFLSDHNPEVSDTDARTLAQAIQGAIEDFFAGKEASDGE